MRRTKGNQNVGQISTNLYYSQASSTVSGCLFVCLLPVIGRCVSPSFTSGRDAEPMIYMLLLELMQAQGREMALDVLFPFPSAAPHRDCFQVWADYVFST